MAKEILSTLQKEFIRLIAKNKALRKQFYLTGGTALAAYYLQHRYSEDLDFFSFENVDLLELNVFIKEIKPVLNIGKVDFQQSFNRNIFFLHAKKEILKTEFTYFPFEQAGKTVQKDGIFIDSIVDISINKVFTISQNPRARDFVDLYCIFDKYKNFSFPKFIKMAQIKFDSYIDPIQLGAQLLKAKDAQDLPRMFKKINHQDWRNLFINQAKALSKEIFIKPR